jgi:hypothetical protein
MAGLVPSVDLQANENTNHNYQQVQRDREPVLILQMLCDAAK